MRADLITAPRLRLQILGHDRTETFSQRRRESVGPVHAAQTVNDGSGPPLLYDDHEVRWRCDGCVQVLDGIEEKNECSAVDVVDILSALHASPQRFQTETSKYTNASGPQVIVCFSQSTIVGEELDLNQALSRHV